VLKQLVLGFDIIEEKEKGLITYKKRDLYNGRQYF